MKKSLLSLAFLASLTSASALTIQVSPFYPESPDSFGISWKHIPGDSVTEVTQFVDWWGTITVSLTESTVTAHLQPLVQSPTTITLPLDFVYDPTGMQGRIGRVKTPNVDGAGFYDSVLVYRFPIQGGDGTFGGGVSHFYAPETGPGAALLGLGLVGAGWMRRRMR